MIWIILWVVFAVLVAAGARDRGRSGLIWFLLACVTSPIIAGIALVLLGRKRKIFDSFAPSVAALSQSIQNAKADQAEKPGSGDGHQNWNCPKCGAENSPHVFQCKECKYSLV